MIVLAPVSVHWLSPQDQLHLDLFMGVFTNHRIVVGEIIFFTIIAPLLGFGLLAEKKRWFYFVPAQSTLVAI